MRLKLAIISSCFGAIHSKIAIGYNDQCLESKNHEVTLSDCSSAPHFIFNTETGKISITKTDEDEEITQCWALAKFPKESMSVIKIRLKSCFSRGSLGPKHFVYSDNQLKVAMDPNFCVNLDKVLPNLIYAERCDEIKPIEAPDFPEELSEKIDDLVEKSNVLKMVCALEEGYIWDSDENTCKCAVDFRFDTF